MAMHDICNVFISMQYDEMFMYYNVITRYYTRPYMFYYMSLHLLVHHYMAHYILP
jgi:hypothetical protein